MQVSGYLTMKSRGVSMTSGLQQSSWMCFVSVQQAMMSEEPMMTCSVHLRMPGFFFVATDN